MLKKRSQALSHSTFIKFPREKRRQVHSITYIVDGKRFLLEFAKISYFEKIKSNELATILILPKLRRKYYYFDYYKVETNILVSESSFP